MTKYRRNSKKLEFYHQTNVNKGFAMENYIFMILSLAIGLLFIWYSQHNESYEKTASVQGNDTAKKKFRVIKLCGYLLVLGAAIFGIFIISDLIIK